MIDLGGGVLLERRSETGLRPPRSRTPLVASFGGTVHWEGPRMGTFPHTSCASKWRGIQAFHMDGRGWSDVAYTVGVCPHGRALEGRWIGTRTAANGTTDGNDRAYAICYLGGQGDPFTDAAKVAIRQTVLYLDAHGGAGSQENCHRNWKATECPGDVICAWVNAGMPTAGPIPAPPDPQELTMAQVEDIYRQMTAISRRLADTAQRGQVGDDAGGVIGRVQTLRNSEAAHHRANQEDLELIKRQLKALADAQGVVLPTR